MKHLNKYEHTTVIKGTKSRPNTAAILVELDANFLFFQNKGKYKGEVMNHKIPL